MLHDVVTQPETACVSSPELRVLTVSCARRSARFPPRSEFVIRPGVVFFIAASPVEQCSYGNFGIPGTRRPNCRTHASGPRHGRRRDLLRAVRYRIAARHRCDRSSRKLGIRRRPSRAVREAQLALLFGPGSSRGVGSRASWGSSFGWSWTFIGSRGLRTYPETSGLKPD